MSKISPKLIDVERNRVEGKPRTTYKDGNKQGHNASHFSAGNDVKKGRKESPVYDKRFPTQLFTNIKNELFKYVKNI